MKCRHVDDGTWMIDVDSEKTSLMNLNECSGVVDQRIESANTFLDGHQWQNAQLLKMTSSPVFLRV
jgi:hypothetical protein